MKHGLIYLQFCLEYNSENEMPINVESWTSVADEHNNMQYRFDYTTITYLKIKHSSTSHLDYIIYFIFKHISIHNMYLKHPL